MQFQRGPKEQFRSEPPSVGWSWRFIVFSAIIFTAVGLLYVGVSFGYKPFLESEIGKVKDDIKKLENSVKPEDTKSLTSFYSQIYNMQDLLANHVAGSKIFSFLEKNTSNDVYYTKADMAFDNYTFTVDGVARGQDAVVRQLEALRRQPEVSNIVLRQMVFAKKDEAPTSATSTLVNFSMKLNFDRNFLKP